MNFYAISSHKGDDIALVLGKCLEDWGLASKLYTIIVGNAGSNSTIVLPLLVISNVMAIFSSLVESSYMLDALLIYLIWLHAVVEGCWKVC